MQIRLLSSATLLSITAGFAGGFVSQTVLAPHSLMAQLESPPPTRPHRRSASASEVDAQRFVLVDSAGLVTGEIKMEDDEPQIILYGKDGRVAWKATTHQQGLQPLNAKY